MVASLYSVDDESQTIWIFLEVSDGNLENVSLELITKGRELADQIGWQLEGLLLGKDLTNLADQAIAHGLDAVLSVDHPLLKNFTIDGYAHVTFNLLLERKPSVFLLGATPNGRDLAGRLAVRLKTGLNADCTDLRLNSEDGILVSEVSGFGGGVLALIEMHTHRPQMATVRPGVFPREEPKFPREGKIFKIETDLSPQMFHTHVVEKVIGESLDLTQSPVLVAGGRGIDGHFDWMYKLADLLGGVVGATRPPVDEGHIERERQIGQTGVVCRPKVAICWGISGAFHFVVGVQDADIVIAVNSDPEAPIFDHADYCVVGDAHQIAPALIKELRTMIPNRKV